MEVFLSINEIDNYFDISKTFCWDVSIYRISNKMPRYIGQLISYIELLFSFTGLSLRYMLTDISNYNVFCVTSKHHAVIRSNHFII